jgi:hypothetical protein
LFRALLTVWRETPAARATSTIVARAPVAARLAMTRPLAV